MGPGLGRMISSILKFIFEVDPICQRFIGCCTDSKEPENNFYKRLISTYVKLTFLCSDLKILKFKGAMEPALLKSPDDSMFVLFVMIA